MTQMNEEEFEVWMERFRLAFKKMADEAAVRAAEDKEGGESDV